jgi:hypothetical protein
MWIRTFSKCYPGVTKEAAWHLWTDINHWAQWHQDLECCTMEGPFEAGNHFLVKPKNVKQLKVVLKEVKKEQSFTDCTTFWGAKMYYTHSMENTPEGLLVSSRIMVSGPLTWFWVKRVVQAVADSVPGDMDTLAEKAKQMSRC